MKYIKITQQLSITKNQHIDILIIQLKTHTSNLFKDIQNADIDIGLKNRLTICVKKMDDILKHLDVIHKNSKLDYKARKNFNAKLLGEINVLEVVMELVEEDYLKKNTCLTTDILSHSDVENPGKVTTDVTFKLLRKGLLSFKEKIKTI